MKKDEELTPADAEKKKAEEKKAAQPKPAPLKRPAPKARGRSEGSRDACSQGPRRSQSARPAPAK